MKQAALAAVLFGSMLLGGCGDDGDDHAAHDAGVLDGGGDSSPAGSDAAAAASVVRGEYLVKTVLGCVDCHTPRGADMRPDMTKFLAGVVCQTDDDRMPMNGTGCLHSANLTNHETGLKNRTDAEIKDMFLKGTRPDGKRLHAVMPYWAYAQLTDADASSIVLYLRTVPAVDNMLPANEKPYDMRPTTAVMAVADSQIPAGTAVVGTEAQVKRGRYLATLACAGCHTPTVMNAMAPAQPLDLTRVFEGGRAFGPMVQSVNLTPHETGIKGYTVEALVKSLREGIDKDGKKVCPPMPSGPMGAYKDLTVEDATDIATYLLALPPKMNMIAMMCAM